MIVSIETPVFKGGWLQRCIDSVLYQSSPQWRLPLPWDGGAPCSDSSGVSWSSIRTKRPSLIKRSCSLRSLLTRIRVHTTATISTPSADIRPIPSRDAWSEGSVPPCFTLSASAQNRGKS